jgi:protein FAM50
MSDQNSSRFTPQNKTTQQRLSTNTVGLVALSDFRKRRAEVLEQQEREAREAAFSGTSTPDRSMTGTPDIAGSDTGSGPGPLKKKKKKKGKKLLSFDDEEEGDAGPVIKSKPKPKTDAQDSDDSDSKAKAKFKANSSVSIVPKSMTKSALRKEAAERDALRREYLALQEAIKATEIAIPFVFYDGSNIPGGMVRVKKGDYIWVFLDKSRKVGADLGVGEKANARREWARVGVDDLMLVRGSVIIPHVSCASTTASRIVRLLTLGSISTFISSR